RRSGVAADRVRTNPSGHPGHRAARRCGAGAPADGIRRPGRKNPSRGITLHPGAAARQVSRQTRGMNEHREPNSEALGKGVVVGPDGVAVETDSAEASGERSVTEMVEQPAKVMRIGSMIRQLLEEVKAAPLDEKSRARLREIHTSSIKELEDGLAPELVEEL